MEKKILKQRQRRREIFETETETDLIYTLDKYWRVGTIINPLVLFVRKAWFHYS